MTDDEKVFLLTDPAGPDPVLLHIIESVTGEETRVPAPLRADGESLLWADLTMALHGSGVVLLGSRSGQAEVRRRERTEGVWFATEDGEFRRPATEVDLVGPMASSNEQYELIARCLARHHNALLRIARPYASGAIQAEDIVQQAAMISLANSDKLRTNEAAVSQWLFRVVKDVGRKVSTKRARRRNLRAEHVHPAPELADPFPLSSERGECVAKVLEAADSLSPDQRRVVYCILHGLPHKETADELDRTVGAIRVLWHRAIRNLRMLLGTSPDGR